MNLGKRQTYCSALMLVALLAWASNAHAKTAEELTIALDTIWVVLTASLVFFMNLGFALVESGFCRSKNTVNILSKNFIVFAISCLAFYVFGWGLMFGNGSGFMGSEGLLHARRRRQQPCHGRRLYGRLQGHRLDGHSAQREVLLSAGLRRHGRDDRFRIGGRAHQVSLLHRLFVSASSRSSIPLPATGSGAAAGWRPAGFWDFAGSTVVHSVGGWAALAGILVLGPRLGKYGPGGKVNPIPGPQHTSGVIGCFVLWLGWFGFNPGSTMAADPQCDRPYLHDDEHGRLHGDALGHGSQLDLGRQAQTWACRSMAVWPAWWPSRLPARS